MACRVRLGIIRCFVEFFWCRISEFGDRNGTDVLRMIWNKTKCCETKLRDGTVKLSKDIRSTCRPSKDYHGAKVAWLGFAADVGVEAGISDEDKSTR